MVLQDQKSELHEALCENVSHKSHREEKLKSLVRVNLNEATLH